MILPPIPTPGLDVLTVDEAITLAWVVRRQILAGIPPHPITIERLCYYIIIEARKRQ